MLLLLVGRVINISEHKKAAGWDIASKETWKVSKTFQVFSGTKN